MALETYRRKRDFKKTPEPPPLRARTRTRARSYLIQKHDATRLHYDFRLELDGVLLSWAVTRGPSLNPADKRLAVRTEDHPLSYGTFEGTIPKGQYGGGTVMLWDKGTWEPLADPRDGLAKGHLSFQLRGKRLKGAWDLIRMRTKDRRENWLLIKQADAEAIQDAHNGASLKRLMTRYPDVQLATLVDDVPDGDDWLHEIKFDGYRLLGFLSNGEVRLRTRNGNDWTDRFPAIVAALQRLDVNDAVVDMEAVVVDADGKTSFQALQNALGDSGNSASIAAFAFDLLHLDGKNLTREPLADRKEKLAAILGKPRSDGALHFSAHVVGHGAKMFSKACAMGLEGVVSKLADAPYTAGRQKAWRKIKCGNRQEFIILGFSAARSGGRAIGALYLGYRKDGRLRYAGKVGTGFTMASASDLAKRFGKLRAKKPPIAREDVAGLTAREWHSIHWVDAKLLCEVEFTEWTSDGRIRHPSFQGLRDDKSANEVKQETPARAPSASAAVSHPDRVISGEGKVTKGALAEYYAAAASRMLPAIVGRPLTLLRCPAGIGESCFYQRNPGRGLGADVRSFEFQHKGKHYEYIYIEDERGLMELVQMGTIEIHPWGAPVSSIDYPDRMIFDLDPAPDVPFEALKLAVQDLRKRLQTKGLDGLLKCTGGKGVHVTVALDGKEKWAPVKSFAESLAAEMVADVPQAYVATMSKAQRTGKIFIDYFRNDYTATAIADYSARARPGIPVAMPLEWSELARLKSADQFTLARAMARLRND